MDKRSRGIEKHTTGFEELESSVQKYTPEYVSQITGLTEDLILRTAYLYGSAKAAFIGWTMGVNHSNYSLDLSGATGA